MRIFAAVKFMAIKFQIYEEVLWGNQDDFEIDIVAETIDGEVEAYEVKRNAKKYNPARLAEKVAYMQRHNFQNKEISIKGLSMDDMVLWESQGLVLLY